MISYMVYSYHAHDQERQKPNAFYHIYAVGMYIC